MSATWTLHNGTVERTIAAWGMSGVSVARRNFEADELAFSIVRKDVLLPAVFAEGTVLTLKRDGTPVFIGTVVEATAVFGGGSEMDRYVARNAWHQLERTIYEQQRCLWNGGFSGTLSKESAQVVLGQTPLGGRYVTTSAAMQEVITFALTKGVPLLLGAVSGGVDFPVEECRDLTCAEVLRRLGAYTPDGVCWIEYGSGAQVLNFGRRASLSAVAYDVLDASTIESASVRPRGDLVPSGVRFDFVGAENNALTGQSMTRITSQIAGASGLPGVIIATIELDSGGLLNQAPVPSDLAGSYFLSLITPQYEGSIITHGRDVLGNARVGMALNLTGGRAEWATMRAVIQTVTEDIAAGTSQIDFGPPDRIPARDFIDQTMFARRKRATTGLWGTMTCIRGGPDIDDEGEVEGTGEEEDNNPDKGRDPKDASSPSVSVQVCEGGEQKTLVIKGQYAS